MDKTIDRLIGAESPPDKSSRGERFDRADFGAKPRPAPPPNSAPPSAPGAAAHALAERPAVPDAAPPAAVRPAGDEGIAADYLRSVGWSPEKVEGILSGATKPRTAAAETRSPSDADDSMGSFRTFEVYGVQGGHPVPLMSVLDRTEGRWQVRPGAQVRATDRATVGMGLAGTPGRWREYYPNHQPEQYGLHAGKAVLYWEPQRGRALAASGGLLTQLFGRNWRSTVYRTEEEHG